MVNDNFKKKIEQESSEFKVLMNILTSINPLAEGGRKLLCLLNHIMDYYLLRKTNDEVKMPIVYFPLCEEWTQHLCEEFVTLKMSLLRGEETFIGLSTAYRCNPNVTLPSNANRRVQKAATKRHQFLKAVAKNITRDLITFPSRGKCLLYSNSIKKEYILSKSRGNYHFCHDIVGTSLSSEKSLILVGDKEDKLYHEIEENDGRIKIPNIFLFLQRDLDGRNMPLCMQMQRSTINEYNEDFDAGVQNVFFFAFSHKPYKLQRIYENKHNLVERLQREKFSETHDFISFTKSEMDYLFDREDSCIHTIELNYEKGSESLQIKKAFDFILQDLPHEVKLRNEMAITFTDPSRSKIKERIMELNPEANEEYVNYFLQLLGKKLKEELAPVLYEWINSNQVAIVLDYNIEHFYKTQLRDFLVSQCGATSVTFYTFKDFRIHKKRNRFVNSIKENKIIVFSMLNHCTGRNWAIYPNSFDQYHLNDGQEVLQVNNKIVFDPRYSWYKYRYMEQQKLLLNSDFRIKYVKNGISLPPRPDILSPEPKDDEDEQNIRDTLSGQEEKRISVAFGQHQHKAFCEKELVLCNYNDENTICSISDILRDFDNPTELKIQPLADFYNPLDVFIDDVERKIGEGESIIRKDPKYHLTDYEKISKREMWKILLQHRVDKFGEQKVYNDIMNGLLPVERIQYNSFKRWLDPNDDSILPRSRRMQRRVIEEYLQIENLYTRMLRHRKSRTCTSTEDKNTIFKTFLTHCLVEKDTEMAFKELSNEVRDYLNISDASDINSIIDLIKEETLNLKQIKSIKQ
ncbi:MAG: hypothetical protein ACOYJF_09040 [Prevotella sp.]|jgi:hypothetical protein